MKLKLILSMVAISLLFACSNNNDNKPQEATKSTTPTTFEDSLSYALGFDIGHSFLTQLTKDSMSIDMDFVYQGLKDGLSPDIDSGSRLISKAQMDSVLNKMQNMMQEKQRKKQAEQQKKYEERKKTAKEDGIKFLADNKKKESVVVEKSGLQHRTIKSGTGPSPKETDLVKFHIVAKYIDGEEFQSTRTMDAPEVPMAQLNMPAMKEAISKMKVGDIWEIVCPPNLAYGEQETGIVPPNSVVIFEIELLDIRAVPKEPVPSPKK
jgi:FKBP-type peptidyl-prolyl cis-trans isomerase